MLWERAAMTMLGSFAHVARNGSSEGGGRAGGLRLLGGTRGHGAKTKSWRGVC